MSNTPRLDAYLRTRELQDDFEEVTADEINRMSPAEYARMTGRSLIPSVSTINALAAQAPVVPAPVVQEETPEPQGLDPNSHEYFLAWRAQRTRGGEGVGIFDGVSSKSEAYNNAARAQSGRTALNESNVIPSPRIARPNLVGVDRPNLDARPLAERFGTANNAYRYE
jgi:hypothetical protein